MNTHIKNKIFIFAALISLSSLFSSCAVNPVSGKKQIVLMSEAQEIAMGKEADPQIIQEYGLYADSSLQRYFNKKGQEMAKISHRPNIAYSFRIVDSDVINAFAVPGGYVYFTRGIMAHFNNEAQFAGVLGHEIGHITARHTVSQQTTQTLTQLGLMVAMISDKRLAQFAESASQGMQLMFLQFSRDAETQSDDLGVQYSSKVGYDAHEMAKFFLTLQRQTAKSNSTLPEFLSTHPDPGNRFNEVNKLATKYQAANKEGTYKINRNSYLQLLNGMVYGADPRQGFVENGIFYHPVLRFQFGTPPNWSYKNSPSQVAFAPADGSAILFLKLAAGKTPAEAAQTFVQQAKLQVSASQETTVNGLPAYIVVGDQLQQNQNGQQVPAVRAMVCFIQYNNLIYELAGATSPENYSKYSSTFQTFMTSFRQLTDASKINKKPERIVIKTIPRNMTLQQALASYDVPNARYEEMAILNGMQLADPLTAGQLLKIVVRQ